MPSMASTTERALLKPPIWSGDGKDGAATMSEMAGQIMALRYRMEFERDRADKAEEELALLMVSKGGEDKGRASTKHRAKEEEEEATAVAGDPVHAAYIHKLERKLAKGGHLLAQEHRRIAQREEEQDWMAMSDTWADKLISAAQASQLTYGPVSHVKNVPGKGWSLSPSKTRVPTVPSAAAPDQQSTNMLRGIPLSLPNAAPPSSHGGGGDGGSSAPGMRLLLPPGDEHRTGAGGDGGGALLAERPSRAGGGGILMSARESHPDGGGTTRRSGAEGGLTARFLDASPRSSVSGSTLVRSQQGQSAAVSRKSSRGSMAQVKRTGFDEWVNKELCAYETEESRSFLEILRAKELQYNELIQLYADVKSRHLQATADANQTAQGLCSLEEETSGSLATFISLAKMAGDFGGKAGELRRAYEVAQHNLADGLNVLCCCKSIAELKHIPKGWRWSHNRAVCGACRDKLKSLLREHSTVLELGERLAAAVKHRDAAKDSISALVVETKRRLANLPLYIQELTTLNTSGHYAWGACFGVAARDRSVVITGIKIGSHPSLKGQRLHVTVYASSKGVPSLIEDADLVRSICLDRSKWVIAGDGDAQARPVGIFDSSPEYGAVPLRHPIEVDAGCGRAICIHTSDRRGLAMRRPPEELHRVPGGLSGGGDVVLQLLAGPAFGPTVFVDLVGDGTVQKSPSSACFAGVLLYTMTS